jgi:hypothetical protein
MFMRYCFVYLMKIHGLEHTPSVSKQKLHFTKYVGLRSFLAFLAQNCVRCIALTKRFPMS